MAARDHGEATMAAAAPSFESEHDSNIVAVDGDSFDQLVGYIADAHRHGTESIISWRCPADVAWDLSTRLNEALIALNEPTIQRFEYDYQSGIAYIDIMPETNLHYQFLVRARNYIEVCLARFAATIPNADIRDYIADMLLDFGTARIAEEGELLKQADFAFGSAMNRLPCLVGEVS